MKITIIKRKLAYDCDSNHTMHVITEVATVNYTDSDEKYVYLLFIV